MPPEPTDGTQNETEDLLQGTVQLTPETWKMLEAKIAGLRSAGATYLWIAESMGITENTLRRLRREKDAYRTNRTDLEGIFNIFNEGRRPQQIAPEEGKHYKYVLKSSSTKPPELPYALCNFHGREKELQRLHDRFQAGEHKQAVSGLGGVGKTQLALKYALQFGNEYKHIFWIQAGAEESVRSRYAEFAGSLRLIRNETRTQTNPQTDEEAAARKQEEQAKAVASFLNWLDTHTNWLLVIDNADAPKFLSKYLPRNPTGHILLTTRTHDLRHLNIYAPLRLKKLSETASLRFLLHTCDCPDEDEDEQKAAADLARELDCLPLALAHAAAYIAHRQTGFAHYLKLYRARKLALLDESGGVPGNAYLTSIRATWEMNFLALETERERDAPARMRKTCLTSARLSARTIFPADWF